MFIPSRSEVSYLHTISTHERFASADKIVRQKFGELVHEDVVRGAFLFGSAQFNDYNSFSDYDIVVMIPDADIYEETAILGSLHRAARAVSNVTLVPMEMSCYNETQLTNGRHDLPEPMLAWLKEQRTIYPDCVIGEDFVPEILPKEMAEPIGRLAEIDEFIARTRHVMKKEWLRGCYFRPRDLLSIVWSAPKVAGRKALDGLSNPFLPEKKLLPNLRKASIQEALSNTFGADSLVYKLADELSASARRFEEELVPSVSMLTDDEYDQLLEATLDDDLPKAIMFLRAMHEEFRLRYNRELDASYNNPLAYWERSPCLSRDSYDGVVSAIRAAQMDSTG